MADIQTTAGTKIYVFAGQPATFDAPGYNALAWVEIGEVSDLGTFGRKYEKIKFKPIGTRATRKLKGSYDEGEMPIQCALAKDDAGQTVLKAAVISDNDYSFKVVSQDGDKYFYQAQVSSFDRNFGSVDNVVMAAIDLDLTSDPNGNGVIEDLAP